MAARLSAAAAFAILVTAGAAAAQDARIERQASGAPADWPKPVMDSQTFTFFEMSKNEYQIDNNNQFYTWDAEGWIGGDYNKLWLKTQGDYLIDDDKTDSAELQALYSRTILPYWNAQVGVRSAFEPTQAWDAVIGMEGLAPLFFKINAAAFIRGEDVEGRVEASYQLLLTQRLITEPNVEVNLSSADIADREVSQGFSSLEAGVRLRYEIIREVAPYIGFEYVRNEAAEDDKDSLRFVTGVRLWY